MYQSEIILYDNAVFMNQVLNNVKIVFSGNNIKMNNCNISNSEIVDRGSQNCIITNNIFNNVIIPYPWRGRPLLMNLISNPEYVSWFDWLEARVRGELW